MVAATSPTTARTFRRPTSTRSTRGPRRSTTPIPISRATNGGRNWDSERRLKELEADGVVAEVIFPNTIPPFFPGASLVHQPPAANEGDLELRWDGLQAHNRWLADFCRGRARPPGRHRADPAARRRRRGRRGPLGQGRRASPVACCCRGAPPGLGPPAAVRARLRAALGGLRRARHADQPSQRQRGARLRRLPRGEGDVPPRGDVVGAPHALAPRSSAA